MPGPNSEWKLTPDGHKILKELGKWNSRRSPQLAEMTDLPHSKILYFLDNAYRAGLVDYKRTLDYGRTYWITEDGKQATDQPPPRETDGFLRRILRPLSSSPGMR